MKGVSCMGNNETNIPGHPEEKLDPLVLKVAAILLIGMLAPLLDTTMVNVAIKTITGDLKSTIAVVQWISTGYVLAMGIAVPVSGWAINRFGGKRLYMFSLGIFLTGSIFASRAWNIESLICFTVLQGAGAGLMMPTIQTMLVRIAGNRNLGRMMSIVSIPTLLGPIFGPVLGGILVSSLSWRWIFYINIPICVIALLLSWHGLPADKLSEEKQFLDWIGILLLSPAFALLILGISKIKSQGGLNSGGVLIPLAIGLLLMAAFITYASKTKNKPVIGLYLFRSRNFSISNALLFLTGFITNGVMLLLPLYYQQVQGETVLLAGLLLIPQGVGMLLTRSWIGRLVDQIGSRVIVVASLAVTALGTLPFAFAGPGTSHVLLAAALLIRGAGLGGLLIPIMASAYIGLEKARIPEATIATRILQTIGGAFGTAILATIVSHQLSGQTEAGIRVVTGAYNTAFWWAAAFTAVAILPAFLLPVRKREEDKPA